MGNNGHYLAINWKDLVELEETVKDNFDMAPLYSSGMLEVIKWMKDHNVYDPKNSTDDITN